MSSSIIFLSDCTPLYTSLGAPGRILNVTATPLHQSVRLVWSLPTNANEVVISSYIIRYGKFGAPGNLINGIMNVFLPTTIIPNLENGVLYSFWVSAKNPFGEGPLSPVVSAYAGSAPSPMELVRRWYPGAGSTTVGIEFTSPINHNGSAPNTFTIHYRRLTDTPAEDISYSQVESVQSIDQIKDVSNNTPLNSNGVKGNFIRKQVVLPVGVDSGIYRFTVVSANIYGTSSGASPTPTPVIGTYVDVTIPSPLPNPALAVTPSFSYAEEGRNVYSITPFDRRFRFRWYRYVDVVNVLPPPPSPPSGYAGWVYRIQYTDDKNYWYYPSYYSSVSTGYFPEYTVPYNDPSIDVNGIHTLDISKNVVNGRRYYVRYCVVDANGVASEYTQITDANMDITSTIPGKPPNPPPIFYAAVDDRLVRLYFNWTQNLNSKTHPPSLDLTGGYPITGYRIDRFKITRPGGIYTENLDVTYDNLPGPFYEDTFDIRINGEEYLYRVYTRTSFGLSTDYTSVTAIPSRKSDIVHDVVASVGNNQITLEWMEPNDIDPGMPISQYYIQYRIYDIFSVPAIPPDNIIGTLTNPTTIGTNIQDMNAILVDDTLWASLSTTIVEKYTFSLNRSYTITDLINNRPYVFRVAAVTIDRARRKMVGLLQVIDDASPYLSRPIVIGVVPARLSDVNFTNLSQAVKIEWKSADLNNAQNIVRFHVDYRIAGSGSNVAYTRRSIDYLSSFSYKDATSAYFLVTVGSLENNVASRPAANSDSYEMFVFAENTVGFTNTSDKVRLHDLRNDNDIPISFFIPYDNIETRKYVRPASTAAMITG